MKMLKGNLAGKSEAEHLFKCSEAETMETCRARYAWLLARGLEEEMWPQDWRKEKEKI